jgi:hypothetical protein
MAGALVAAVLRRHELASAFDLMASASPPKAFVALLSEAAALLCLAGMQRWLLLAGGLRMPLPNLTRLTLAANAMAGVFPGGSAFSAAWLFRQLSPRGAGQALAGAVLVVSGALSALGLLVVLSAGAITSGARGPGGLLRRALLALAVLAAATLVLARSPGVRVVAARAWRRARARYARAERAGAALERLLSRARDVQPGFRPWLRPYALAQLNWVLDAACLAACLWALGSGVPWHGLLLTYGLAQIPGSLRLIPGGVGVVEASLAALLGWTAPPSMSDPTTTSQPASASATPRWRNSSTADLIGEDEFRTMKPGMILINTSRGSAFNTREAVHRILSTTCENIEAFAAGQPKNTVP